MKGFPKHLNSKQDYIYIRENFPAEQWKPVWQDLLDGQKNWFCVGKLDSKDAGITDSTHKVVESVNQQDEKTEYYQYELQKDYSCDMFRLGFTEAEVVEAING